MSLGEGKGGRTVNIKLGLDIIPRTNGNPSLRIREFKGPKIDSLRKFGNKINNSQISIRADSTSVESDDNKEADKDEKLADESDNIDGVAESSDSEDRAHRSTKGINPEEFEPERIPTGIHGRGRESDSDSDGK
ncbi:uncharacterized protein LOC123695035 isoform X1 [Colias croceus]|uniref:uncharacterized protein LOC123695035 isoform X1 n=1 Tax=Colias crocea TaxID=72248 RepID=UPI001E27A34B|nr:uncharacterized protein LOC123695035 isoform X1 [Colias croceus]